MPKDKSSGKKLADMMYGSDQIRATPQSRVTGPIANALRKAQQFASQYEVSPRIPLLGGTGVDELLSLPEAASLMEDISYNGPGALIRGGNVATGGIGTFRPDPRIASVADVAGTATGVGSLATKGATKGALAAGRAGSRLADKAVPQIMERGGLGADILSGMAQGSRSNVITKKPEPFVVAHGSNDVFDQFKSGQGITAKHIYTTPENLSEDAAKYGSILYKAQATPKNIIDFSDESKLDKPTLNALKKAAKDAGIIDKYHTFDELLQNIMDGQLYQAYGGQRTQNALLDELFLKYDAVKMPDATTGGGLSTSIVFKNPENLTILERKKEGGAVQMKEGGAAFGVFPQMRRKRSKQDPEAAKNFPVDLARGVIAGAVGMPGDIESLARLPYELITGNESPTILPTSEDVLKRIPFGSDTPASQFASGLGTLAGGSANIGAAPRMVKKGALAAGRAGERMAEKVVPGIMERGGAGADILSGLAQGSRSQVIKPKGGNWQKGSIEKAIDPLRRETAGRNDPAEMLQQMRERYTPEVLATMQEGSRQNVLESIAQLEKDVALNNWIDRNLTNYIKKEMATPEDPVRKLAEEGILHFQPQDVYLSPDTAFTRTEAGYPRRGMSKSQLAIDWEALSDKPIGSGTAGEMLNIGKGEPWMEKVDPFTRVHGIAPMEQGSMARDLGFDHILDVLRQDLAEGRIRPEQLSKVSMEQAVRRTYEYDQEMAKKMREAQIKATEGMPVYREYPEGYRWIELAQPKITAEALPAGYEFQTYKNNMGGTYYSLRDMNNGGVEIGAGMSPELAIENAGKRIEDPRLEEALKYEGDTMGHCVGGYCPDVAAGRSRIFSLRDAKGEPHVTVEVQPNQVSRTQIENAGTQRELGLLARRLLAENPDLNYDDADRLAYEQLFGKQPDRIVQIKGKQNRAPKDEYLPFVQDFVRSGQWSDVGDLGNTGLFKLGSDYMTEAEAAAKYKPMTQEALNFLETHPALEQHRIADKAYSGFKGDPLAPEYREIERAAGSPISPSVPYTYRELRALLSSPEDWTERNGTIYEPISKAIEKINEAKKELGLDLPPQEGMAHGGRVHISDNPDVMALEMAGGGLVKGLKAAVKATKAGADAPKPIVEAPGIIIPSKIQNVREAVRNREGNYGAKRVERAADEIRNLEKMFTEEALRSAFTGDNAKAVVTMNPADFEKYANILIGRTQADIGPRMAELAKQGDINKHTVPTDEYIQHLMRVQGGFDQVPYLNLYKDEVGLPIKPEVRGHEGRHRSRALTEAGEPSTLVEINPRGDLREGLPRRSQEEYIEALREELGLSDRLVLPQTDGTSRRQAIILPEPYAEGGEVSMAAGGLAKAAKALKAAKEAPMKASEALGRVEGRPLVITQADRTKVGGGFLGGPGFSGLQLEDPAYRAAEAAWGVKTPGVAKMILGGGKAAGKDPVYAAMLGTPTQHQSNQMVFDKLYGDFKKSAKKGNLDPDLRDRINMRLANTVDKEGNPIFPPDVDILGKNFKELANTFDRRAVTANLIGGMGVGGKKGQIIDYDKIIRETTDPLLLDAPTGALGNRLFTLSGGIIDRPDLHPAFPTILQGEDLGVSFNPVARDLIMKDFMEQTMREKGRAPGYMDYTRGYPPSQLITEDLLTELQKLGLKEGGAVHKAVGGDVHGLSTADLIYLQSQEDLGKLPPHAQNEAIHNMGRQEVRQRMSGKYAAGGEITADDLILEERKL